MKVNLWGVRGSIPTTDPATTRYGGNTSCVDVWEDGHLLILDGGSGIARLKLKNPIETNRIDILLTHLHLDHIQGLGFFRSLFDPKMEIHIWGPASSTHSLHSRLSRYLSPPLFPVLLRDLPCNLQLHELGNTGFDIGPFHIRSQFIIHPGPTVGYRIKGAKSVVTYIPDHEPALGPKGMIPDRKWVSGFDLAHETDLLYHDAQYTADEYPVKKGWGHSSVEDAGIFARITEAKRVLFAHHDPMRTDDMLDAMLAEFEVNSGKKLRAEMATEGTEIILD